MRRWRKNQGGDRLENRKEITLDQVIQKADGLVPNSFSREDKVGWLSAFDGQICREILSVHEGWDEAFRPYDPREGSRSLLVPEPYGMELYVAFLENTMDHYNGDTARYNNSLDRLAGLYNSFFRAYHRDHLPLGRKRKFW